VRPSRRNRPAKVVPEDEAMTTLRSLVALLFGLAAFTTLGALLFPYMVDVGADVMLAVIAAVTPPAAP
jgi:hypothetical protein